MLKNIKKYKNNVVFSVGGVMSMVMFIEGYDVENWESMVDVVEGEGLLYEYNKRLDMVMGSNVDGGSVLLYNGDRLSDDEVKNIFYDEDGFFKEEDMVDLCRYDMDLLLG